MKGEDWARHFLYVPSGGRKMPLRGWSWVANCPEGVDPRTEENPWVMTWDETRDEEVLSEIRDRYPEWEDTWIRVGAAGGLDWINIDIDLDGHDEVLEQPEGISFAHDDVTVIETSGGFHLDVLGEDLDGLVGRAVEGIDYQGNMPGVMGVAGDPYHGSDGYTHKNSGQVLAADEATRDSVLDGTVVSHLGRSLIKERAEERSDVGSRAESEAEAPEEVPYCIQRMLVIRSSQLRYEYLDNPFDVDKHLGQLLVFNGYSVEDAFELLREYPPDKDGGFNADETMRQLKMLKAKTDSGDLSPPTVKLLKNDIDIHECDCAAHERFGVRPGSDEDGGLAIPRAMSVEQVRRRDKVEYNRAKADVRRTMSQRIDGPMVYHAPQGLGKTRYTPYGASDVPRLVITTNKGEHRDTLEWASDQAGVTCEHIVPFGDSWLATSSPVRQDVRDLYHKGVQPRFIIEEYSDIIPDDVVCPYMDQFGEEAPAADVLLGSPGHENVKQFRSYPGDEPGSKKPREVVYDDVNPADEEITENTFKLDDARAELNELLQEIPELGVNSVSALLEDRDALADVERLAVGDGEEDEEDEPSDNVWDELDRRASQGDAIVIDILDIVRRRENVRGNTVIKLKVVAGAEMRTVEPMSWEDGGHQWYSWVSHPDLRDHEVAVLSATHMPHVTDRWLETACGETAVHRSATNDWKAVRRAQGYMLIQTRGARNSRSGAGAYHDNPEERRQQMRGHREELREAIEELEGESPGVIDAKKLLEDDEGINFARVWSNNEYKDRLIGLVAGATYYGDEWVKARAAYCGRNIDILHERGEKAKCADEVGADLMHYMTSTAVEQSVTRFGRSTGEETRVYLDTDVVPPHFPAIDVSERIVRLTQTQKSILEAARDGKETLEDLGQAAGVTRSMAGRAVWQLDEMGYVKVHEKALAYGRHRVEDRGKTAIGSINIVQLPEIPRGLNQHLLRDDVEGPAGAVEAADDSLDDHGMSTVDPDGRIIRGSDEREAPDYGRSGAFAFEEVDDGAGGTRLEYQGVEPDR